MTRIDDWPMKSNAQFSPDRKYRYTLSRTFLGPNGSLPVNPRTVVFIMLNPSTADENVADPTVRRCMTYARDWGYDKLVVLNIFAIRSTDPKLIYLDEDPIGPNNDKLISMTINTHRRRFHDRNGNVSEWEYPLVICAWGTHGEYRYRGQAVKQIVQSLGITPHYLKLTGNGQPSHPLYLSKDLHPVEWV